MELISYDFEVKFLLIPILRGNFFSPTSILSYLRQVLQSSKPGYVSICTMHNYQLVASMHILLLQQQYKLCQLRVVVLLCQLAMGGGGQYATSTLLVVVRTHSSQQQYQLVVLVVVKSYAQIIYEPKSNSDYENQKQNITNLFNTYSSQQLSFNRQYLSNKP